MKLLVAIVSLALFSCSVEKQIVNRSHVIIDSVDITRGYEFMYYTHTPAYSYQIVFFSDNQINIGDTTKIK